jgi:hypothetical protein
MDKFQNKYRIPSTRLQHWNYGWNAVYYVTICTHHRLCFFGEIMDGKMELSKIGSLANKYWLEIPAHFPFVKLRAFVIMPNHVHGIIMIDKTDDSDDGNSLDDPVCDPVAGSIVAVETLHATSLRHKQQNKQHNNQQNLQQWCQQTQSKFLQINKNEQMAAISPKQGSLSAIIRSYKSAVTQNARFIDSDFAWQSRFYEHIIRDDESCYRISKYINNNPSKWGDDKFNPDKNRGSQ